MWVDHCGFGILDRSREPVVTGGQAATLQPSADSGAFADRCEYPAQVGGEPG